MQEENISGSESLQIIQAMINKAKNQFSENGHLYLLWGWVIFICCISQFILMNYIHYEKHYLVWLLTWVAVVYQAIYLRRKNKALKVKTYADDIVGYVWIAFIITMFLCGFSLGSTMRSDQQQYYRLMGPVFLALYGIPTFLSGIILQFKPLVWGGIFCWVLSMTAGFIDAEYQILLLAIAVAIAWIVPGYLLKHRFNKQNN